MRKWLVFSCGIALLVLLAGCFPLRTPEPAQVNSIRFERNDVCHVITDEFAQFYNQATNPELVYGYPITDSFQDPLTGMTVQYFQRARFELHLEAPAGQRVKLSPLGRWRDRSGKVISLNQTSASCRTFPETGYTVCDLFLRFYNEHGSVQQFGLPISPVVEQDQRFVQYFENARFEYRPDDLLNGPVVLTDLGRMDFEARITDPSLLACVSNAGAGDDRVEAIRARAFVSQAVLQPNSEETIFVVVQDEDLQPVELAKAAITLRFANGESRSYPLPPTDDAGIATLTFHVSGAAPGDVVQVDVEVSYSDLQTNAFTWFRVWW